MLLLLGALLLIGAYLGLLPTVRETMQRLASRPDVAGKFADPAAGRAEALFMLLVFLLMTPLTALAAFVVGGFTVLVLMALLRPLATALGMPEWAPRAVLVLALLGVVYATSGLWLPASMKLVSLVARAYVVVRP